MIRPKRNPVPGGVKSAQKAAADFAAYRIPKKRKGPARRVSVVRDQGYKNWCKTQQCVACAYQGHDWRAFPVNLPLSATIDPAHTAPTNGMSSKGPDSSCVPMCRWHHDEMDGRVSPRIVTKEQFAAKYGLDLAAIAAEHYARFKGEMK